MKKLVFGLVLLAVTFSNIARADEGMWLPFLLGRNYEDMKKHGLRLSQEQIYSINKSSMKDAVISFGGFCTGEVISDKSLVLTNHHCGYDAIAGASTPEKNYLDNGFWAKNTAEEIPVPGLTATFMIRMEDVSASILKELNPSMTQAERAEKIKKVSDVLIADATRGTNYEAFVRDFYDGNEFYLFVKETYKDVRWLEHLLKVQVNSVEIQITGCGLVTLRISLCSVFMQEQITNLPNTTQTTFHSNLNSRWLFH